MGTTVKSVINDVTYLLKIPENISADILNSFTEAYKELEKAHDKLSITLEVYRTNRSKPLD